MTYTIGKLLGNGSYGKVFLAHNKKDVTHQVAIKIIEKIDLDEEDIQSLKNEVGILQKVDHPNIVKYYETYEDPKKLYLVMEHLDGGEILDTIMKSKTNIEASVRDVMGKMARALIHINSLNITHKDIKPDNIMFSDDGTPKLIDFGLSQITKNREEKMDTVAGTPYFLAPEVLKGFYGQECDIWSLGITMYQCLLGCFPFDGKSRDEVFAKIQTGEFDTTSKKTKKLSPECIDILKQMILVDPKKRIKPVKMLTHPWFKSAAPEIKAEVDEETIKRL